MVVGVCFSFLIEYHLFLVWELGVASKSPEHVRGRFFFLFFMEYHVLMDMGTRDKMSHSTP